MLPSPLHPAVVHFPIVFMLLLPLAALGALWAIRSGWSPIRAWVFPVALAAALTLSAWAAVETGEGDEERAEAVVGEQALESHQAHATRFLDLSGGVLLVMAIGLMAGVPGRSARVLGTVAALGLIVAGYQVGHSGGRIVYGDATTAGLVSAAGAAGEGATGEREGARADDD